MMRPFLSSFSRLSYLSSLSPPTQLSLSSPFFSSQGRTFSHTQTFSRSSSLPLLLGGGILSLSLSLSLFDQEKAETIQAVEKRDGINKREREGETEESVRVRERERGERVYKKEEGYGLSGWIWGTEEASVVYEEIPTPQSDEEIRAIADVAIQELLYAFSSEDTEWCEFAYSAPGGEDIRLYDKPNATSSVIPLKCTALINAPVEKVFGFVGERDPIKLHATVDPDLMTSETLKDLGNGVFILYEVFEVGPLISPREFVYVQAFRDLPDGTRLIAYKSINYPQKKQAANQIRGVVAIAGMKISPNKENPDQCITERTVQVDPKGMLPMWAVKLNKSNNGDRMMRIRGLVGS